jgi:hypothetical protein
MSKRKHDSDEAAEKNEKKAKFKADLRAQLAQFNPGGDRVLQKPNYNGLSVVFFLFDWVGNLLELWDDWQELCSASSAKHREFLTALFNHLETLRAATTSNSENKTLHCSMQSICVHTSALSHISMHVLASFLDLALVHDLPHPHSRLRAILVVGNNREESVLTNILHSASGFSGGSFPVPSSCAATVPMMSQSSRQQRKPAASSLLPSLSLPFSQPNNNNEVENSDYIASGSNANTMPLTQRSPNSSSNNGANKPAGAANKRAEATVSPPRSPYYDSDWVPTICCCQYTLC